MKIRKKYNNKREKIACSCAELLATIPKNKARYKHCDILVVDLSAPPQEWEQLYSEPKANVNEEELRYKVDLSAMMDLNTFLRMYGLDTLQIPPPAANVAYPVPTRSIAEEAPISAADEQSERMNKLVTAIGKLKTLKTEVAFLEMGIYLTNDEKLKINRYHENMLSLQLNPNSVPANLSIL